MYSVSYFHTHNVTYPESIWQYFARCARRHFFSFASFTIRMNVHFGHKRFEQGFSFKTRASRRLPEPLCLSVNRVCPYVKLLLWLQLGWSS